MWTKAARLGEFLVQLSLEHHARSAICCCARCKVRNLRELRSSTHLTSRARSLYCGDCTEVGAPEVDGLLIGSRFGGGQSGSRTREPPPRCIFCCARNSIANWPAAVRARVRCDSARNLVVECERAQIAPFLDSAHLTECIAPPRFPCAPRTERRRLMALPIGTRFGGGQSGSRTKGQPARCIFCGPAASRRTPRFGLERST